MQTEMSDPNGTNTDDGLILCGYQKKLNTMKKKFFVLYKDSTKEEARLEYFDSIKKFKSGATPKRIVKLAACLNINRRFDTKHDYVIALATKDGGFGIVLESEEEMSKWLQALLALQRSVSIKHDTGFPTFDHVWQVVVQKKNLAEERKIIGSYHACLSSKCVTFVRIGSEKSSAGLMRATDIQVPLNTIRRCGDSYCLFYMEVGRQCTIGPGELWMETEDPLVAQSMHRMISSAMSTKAGACGDSMRKRSLSVTETSKSTRAMEMGNINLNNKLYNMNISANNNPVRGRCDSFPSRTRELKDDFRSANVASSSSCSIVHHPLTLPRYNSSAPVASAFVNTERRESAKVDDQEESGNYLSFRFKTAERPIPEENSEDLLSSDNVGFHKEANISMAPGVKSLDSTEYKMSQQGNRIDIQTSLVASDLIPEMHAVLISTDNDLNCEERPKRSYSIGSKIDKNKIQRLGNSNDILQDTNAVRVRAFSVGSRAKIPKCGLQRSVLFPKSYLNQSCNSNNSLNSGTDDTGHKFELNTSCNKKSTSAPILIQNGQVPIDSMSDLMEIDFSKSSNHKAHKSGSVNGKNPGLCLNEFKSTITSPHLKSIGHDESGYLEMKPVECTIGASRKLLPARDPYNKGNENEGMKLKPKHFDGDKSDHASYNENIVGLSSVYSSLAKQTCSEMHADSNQNCAICHADKRNKAIGNMCWETNNLKNVLSDSQTEKEQNIYFPEKVDNLRSPDISQLEYELSSKAYNSANKNKHSFFGNSIADNKTVQTSKSTCSPSSSSCYELYYAKLDLPQCNSKDNTKLEKPNISSKNTENDSYAKIDFEHSSDSSSSSKILTN